VCSFVLDGGGCSNVALLSMVEKLNLQAIAHPHPIISNGLTMVKDYKLIEDA